MKLHRLTQFLDEYLAVGDFKDIALNGLQVEGRQNIKKAALAVDACTETFLKAASLKADILITHHGIFWGKPFPLTGIYKNRVKALLDNGISLYAVHLPLDVHEESGNNTGLIRLLGFEVAEPFGEYKGIHLGYSGTVTKPVSYDTMMKRLKRKLGVKPVGYRFGKDTVGRIAVISGEGAGAVEEAAAKNIDLFITGELSHKTYHLAKELRLNICFCGHYATETLGVQNLGTLIGEKFGLDTIFIDVPTGM